MAREKTLPADEKTIARKNRGRRKKQNKKKQDPKKKKKTGSRG
jgi:hypothetical protein